MRRPRRCEFRSIDARRHVCNICHKPLVTAGAYPRRIVRECPGAPVPAAKQAMPALPPSAPPIAEGEIEGLRRSLGQRHTLGLATVPWVETERRLAICRRCPQLLPAGDSLEIRCRRCGGCSGDRGHQLRVMLTTDERDCPAGLFTPRPVRPAIERRNLLYHVFPAAGWREPVAELVEHWGAFNGRRVVAIATGDGLDSPRDVRRVLPSAGVEWIEVENDPRLREVKSFLPLLNRVADCDPAAATFYAHTKALSTAENQLGAARWRRAMHRHLLGRLPEVLEGLRRFPFVGTHKIIWQPGTRPPYPTGLMHGHWMHAGTFYWFRHDAVFGHANWREIPDDRYGAEAWPAGMFSPEDGLSLYQPWPEWEYPTPSPYDPELYAGEGL